MKTLAAWEASDEMLFHTLEQCQRHEEVLRVNKQKEKLRAIATKVRFSIPITPAEFSDNFVYIIRTFWSEIRTIMKEPQ